MASEKRLKILEAEEQLLKEEITRSQRKLDNVRTKIKVLKPKEIGITDHAVIRFAERVYQLDLNKLKAEILKPEIVEQIKLLGGKGKFTADGVSYIVEDNKIITVY